MNKFKKVKTDYFFGITNRELYAKMLTNIQDTRGEMETKLIPPGTIKTGSNSLKLT